MGPDFMAGLKQRWLDFWFEPSEPTNLSLCRILFYGAVFFFYLPEDFSAWTQVSQVFWVPTPLFSALGGALPPAEFVAVLGLIWKVSVALSCIGLFTRVSTKVAFFLGIYLIGLAHNFGKFDAKDAILFPVLAILAFSQAGDAFSVDRLMRRRSWQEERLSGEYAWPIKLVWLVMALSFFSAGVSKLRESGLDWILSENLAMIMAHRNNSLSLLMAQQQWLCRLIAGTTIILELGAPLALLGWKFRVVFISSLFMMQVGFVVVMQILFHNLILCYIFWVPWNRFLTEAQKFPVLERLFSIYLRRHRIPLKVP